MDASDLLADARIVPVVVVDSVEDGVRLARVLSEAKLEFVEVTLRTDAALAAIAEIARHVPEICVGAGSVRSTEQMVAARQAGARFAVSPGATDALLDAARENDLPFVPGAATASEILRLLEHGYRLQKFFPAELCGGTAMLKALGAPIPEARFFPTGGITSDLAAGYLALSNVACVGGTWIAPRELVRSGNFEAIGVAARGAVEP